MRICGNASGVHSFSRGSLGLLPGVHYHRSLSQHQRRSPCRRNSEVEKSVETQDQTDTGHSEIQAALSSWQEPSGQRLPSQDNTSQSAGASPQGKTEAEKGREVAEALRQVEEALKSAQDKLEDIPNLPSARPRRKVCDSTLGYTSPPHAYITTIFSCQSSLAAWV